MGRIVVVNFVSIDGVIQSPLSAGEDRDGGFAHGGWVPPDSDGTVETFMQAVTTRAAGMLLGRRTYEIMTDAWSGADDAEPAVAAMNDMPKHVVSSTRPGLSWRNSHWVGGDVRRDVGDLRAGSAGDLVVFGSGALVRGLAEHDLVDAYRMLLFPVVLGAGKRMFDARAQRARFSLTDSVVAGSGVVILTYTRRSTG